MAQHATAWSMKLLDACPCKDGTELRLEREFPQSANVNRLAAGLSKVSLSGAGPLLYHIGCAGNAWRFCMSSFACKAIAEASLIVMTCLRTLPRY